MDGVEWEELGRVAGASRELIGDYCQSWLGKVPKFSCSTAENQNLAHIVVNLKL